jgi:hypothetical protein
MVELYEDPYTIRPCAAPSRNELVPTEAPTIPLPNKNRPVG